MKRLILTAFVLMLFTTVTAHTNHQNPEEHIETAIITSSANYPDSFIAEPGSETIGAPVLITENDRLSEKTSDTLNRLGVEEAILVGGPSVISENAEAEIESEVDSTTRLWGTTQIGTSVEVSDYFWSSSDEATVVQYPQDSKEGYKLLSRAVEESDDKPLLVSKEGTLSASALSEIEQLNSSEVRVISTNAVNVTEDLNEIGVEEVELDEVSLDNIETEDQENSSEMVVVGASSFRDVISSASSRGSAVIIDNEAEISTAVERAQSSSAEKIYVTGQPSLAQSIAERLRSETDKQVMLMTGEPEEVSANLTSQADNDWSEEQQEKLGEWKENIKNSPGLQKAANRTIRNADRALEDVPAAKAKNLLQKAKTNYDMGRYFEAKKLAIRSHSITRSDSFRSMENEEIEERVQEEREDVREATRELRELGQEQAQELQEAESVEERLEIVREHREKRREELKDLREDQRERRNETAEKRDRNREAGERFRQEPGDGAVGDSKLSLEVDNSEIKAKAEYTGSTAGYTKNISLDKSNSSVTFVIQLRSPEGPSAQALTDYRVEKETELEEGNYTARVVLNVDGENVQNLERDIKIPSSAEFEVENESEEESETESEERTEDSERPDQDQANSGADENTVTYTQRGFQPKEITVEQGEDVKWVNQNSENMWVASDRHPTHTDYDGTSTSEHCEDGESDTFDQCSAGDEYEFEFENTGEWNYHNHLNPGDGGTVTVE